MNQIQPRDTAGGPWTKGWPKTDLWPIFAMDLKWPHEIRNF